MGHIGPNLNMIFLEWSSSKIMSSDLAVYPRWLPWLLIGWTIGNLWKSSSEQLDGMKLKFVQIVLGWSPSKIYNFLKFLPSDLINILILYLDWWNTGHDWFWGICLLSFQHYIPYFFHKIMFFLVLGHCFKFLISNLK